MNKIGTIGFVMVIIGAVICMIGVWLSFLVMFSQRMIEEMSSGNIAGSAGYAIGVMMIAGFGLMVISEVFSRKKPHRSDWS